MTTPGTHNDTYASSTHRAFFSNKLSGKDLKDCPESDSNKVD
jgi:hypothetical protein